MTHDTKKNAIWIASYPKSGNTWMRLVLQAYFRGGWLDKLNDDQDRGKQAANVAAFESYLGICASHVSCEEIMKWRPAVLHHETQKLDKKTLIKVHDQAKTSTGDWMFPKAGTLGVLHLVRDPRDVVISWASHKGFSIDQSIAYLNMDDKYNWQSITQGHTQLPQFMGNWSTHTQSWLEAASYLPLLTQRYEDRLLAPKKTLIEVLDFLRLESTDDLIERILNATDFKRVQSLEDQEGFSEKPPEMDRFFRQGTSGAWRQTLTAQQRAQIERKHGKMMEQLGYL